MESRKYDEIRISRAKSEFWGYLKKKWKLDVSYFIIGTGANYNFNDINWPALYCEILGVLFFICVMFLWKSFRVVPKCIYEEQQKTINAQRKTIDSLKERQRSKLEVTFEEGEKPWFQTQPNVGNPYSSIRDKGDLYTYRIGLMNHGLETVKKIKVKLTDLTEIDHPTNAVLPVVPCHLHFMNDINQPFDESKDLQMTKNPIDGLFVDVFSCFRGHKSNKRTLEICHIMPEYKVVPTKSYEITITVNSDNGGEHIERRFRFDANKPNAARCMKMIN